jgi:hypothetical protein
MSANTEMVETQQEHHKNISTLETLKCKQKCILELKYSSSKLCSSRLLFPTPIQIRDKSAWVKELGTGARQEPCHRATFSPESQHPTRNRERTPTHRRTVTSDFPDGAEDHRLIVRGSKQVAVAGALTFL